MRERPRDKERLNHMIGMRHILVHGYYQIKDEIVWATIETELQPLKEKILLLLQDY